jgi:hypothetical protein
MAHTAQEQANLEKMGYGKGLFRDALLQFSRHLHGETAADILAKVKAAEHAAQQPPPALTPKKTLISDVKPVAPPPTMTA